MKMYRLEQAHRCAKQANWPRDDAGAGAGLVGWHFESHLHRDRVRVCVSATARAPCRCCKRALPHTHAVHCAKEVAEGKLEVEIEMLYI